MKWHIKEITENPISFAVIESGKVLAIVYNREAGKTLCRQHNELVEAHQKLTSDNIELLKAIDHYKFGRRS